MENEIQRNPFYQFLTTDVETVAAELLAAYEQLFRTTVRPGDPERLFIQWVAHVVVQERMLSNWTANQNIPSRAEGENLDALAELTYIQQRPEAKYAGCTVRFQLSEAQDRPILIPAGTRVTDAEKTLFWQTLEDHYFPAGADTLDVQVQCQTPGTSGNGYAEGQINKLVDVFEYYHCCRNITVSGGGSDVPTDEEYYELMRKSMDAYSCAGARGSYIYWAMQVSTEIADVAVNSPVPGAVDIYVLMDDGTLAGEEIKGKVLAACSADTVRPLTDLVSVKDAELVPYDIRLTYYTHRHSRQSGADTAAAVQKAVEEYIAWQYAKLGRDINPSRLTSLVMQAGVKRVDIQSPVFTRLRDGNLPLGADMSYNAALAVPQLASVGSVQIVDGGIEDE